MTEVKTIDSQQLKDWLASGDTLLIDVREPHEFSESRIPHASSMPLTHIDYYLEHLQGEKRKVVFQCLKGKRGEMAAIAAMEKYGDTVSIYNLTGGIEAWEMAGFTVARKPKDSEALPIMRQVQIIAGGLIIFFAFMALLGSKFAAFITLLIGGGLLFAGLTGSCAMATLLQKMPWNRKKDRS